MEKSKQKGMDTKKSTNGSKSMQQSNTKETDPKNPSANKSKAGSKNSK